jgi:hypothetical protein
MRTISSVLAFGLHLAFGISAAAAAPGGFNAVWHAGPKDDRDVVFQAYEKEGTCESLRAAPTLPLNFGAKGVKAGESRGPLQVKDLSFCLVFLKDWDKSDPYGETTSCASGTVEFAYDGQSKEYRGKYDLTMKNKAVRRGEFRAQLCTPAMPVKK